MILQKGQRYRCQNRECAAEMAVTKDSVEGASNPKCCCGREMKKVYSNPVLKTFDKDDAVIKELFARRA
jgi:hypothetical protein